MPREERQLSFPKRAAFALVTAAENLPGRDLGAQPCELCGQWAHSWCEACSLRPFNAVCTLRDADPVVCRPCQRLGRPWEAARAANTTPPDCVELSGYHDQTGRFVHVDPPLRIPPTDGWHPQRPPVGPDGRRRVSGEDKAVRVSPTHGVI